LEAQARRDAAQRRVQEADARLSYCSVRAPIDGVVLETQVTPGQFVSAAVPMVLLTVVDDTRRRVRADIDERGLPKVCLHQRAHITPDGVPGVKTDGVVESIRGGITATAGPNGTLQTFRQIIQCLPDTAAKWPIGLQVSVQLSACAQGPESWTKKAVRLLQFAARTSQWMTASPSMVLAVAVLLVRLVRSAQPTARCRSGL
jgi:multidrug efflux pump subunit AcrA (membrane-fusion protein)